MKSPGKDLTEFCQSTVASPQFATVATPLDGTDNVNGTDNGRYENMEIRVYIGLAVGRRRGSSINLPLNLTITLRDYRVIYRAAALVPTTQPLHFNRSTVTEDVSLD